MTTLYCEKPEKHEKNDFNIVDFLEWIIEEGRNLKVSSRVIADTIIQRLLEKARKET